MERKPIVLAVDDNICNSQVVADIMDDLGYKTVLARTGKDVFDYIANELPDLLLLDAVMPDMDGYEICRQIKSDIRLKNVPVIFLTAKHDLEDIVRGFESGGVDYIAKPFNPIELKMRVKAHIDIKRYRDEVDLYYAQLQATNNELNSTNRLIQMKNIQLKEIMRELDEASKTDPLTGLSNRRCMTEKLHEEIIKFKRNKKPFSIMLGDIDFFKAINDTHGHDYGDCVLKAISKSLLSNMRELDAVSRWGGEEFLILMPETGLEDAKRVGERLRQSIEQLDITHNNITVRATITLGLVVYDDMRDDTDSVIKKADRAMYIGKSNGRNRVVVYSHLT